MTEFIIHSVVVYLMTLAIIQSVPHLLIELERMIESEETNT
jgi:hypothetical protein